MLQIPNTAPCWQKSSNSWDDRDRNPKAKFDGLEIINRWIPTLFERGIDPLHNDVMDFATLFEGSFAQRFMHREVRHLLAAARRESVLPYCLASIRALARE
jgi:hypothetical protein